MRLSALIMLLVIYGVISIILFNLAACGTHARANIHHVINQDKDTLGQNPHCELEIIKPINSRIDARLLHQSWCFTNWPFNDKPESTVNAIGVGVKLW